MQRASVLRLQDSRHIFEKVERRAHFGDKPAKLPNQIVARIQNYAMPHRAEPLARGAPDQSIQPSQSDVPEQFFAGNLCHISTEMFDLWKIDLMGKCCALIELHRSGNAKPSTGSTQT